MKSHLSVLAVSALLLSGCGGSPNSSGTDSQESKTEASASWLDERSAQTEIEDRKAFESLLSGADEFTNIGLYFLPVDLQLTTQEVKINPISFLTNLSSTEEDGSWSFYPVFELNYLGKDWAFINSLYLKFDSSVREFSRYGDDSSSTVVSGGLRERMWFHFKDATDIEFLAKIFTASSIKLRVGQGINGSPVADRELTEVEKARIKTILQAYRHMKNENLLSVKPTVKLP